MSVKPGSSMGKETKNRAGVFFNLHFKIYLIFDVLTPLLSAAVGLFPGASFLLVQEVECPEKTTDLG